VHPTLGILPQFQAFFYALAFFWLDGVPPSDPARLTHTVSPLHNIANDKDKWFKEKETQGFVT
jgi:hypothetical protein